MKRITLTICVVAFLFGACNNNKTEAESASSDSLSPKKEEPAKEKAWIPIDSAAMEKAWMESMAIGEPHKIMAKGAGTWTGDVTMWMADGAPPMKSTSTSVNTMLFGGLYQQAKHSGTMMRQPFEGISTMAYDNTTKEFVSTWIDNMGSGIMLMKGNWNDATKSITLTGKMKNPANGLDCSMREVFKIVDDNHQVLEMYGPDPATGKEYKNMEIQYTRKK
ncbi:MAG: DUF1579 domain-containing protein [Chitinophagaceae bacterium]